MRKKFVCNFILIVIIIVIVIMLAACGTPSLAGNYNLVGGKYFGTDVDNVVLEKAGFTSENTNLVLEKDGMFQFTSFEGTSNGTYTVDGNNIFLSSGSFEFKATIEKGKILFEVIPNMVLIFEKQ